MPATHRVRPKCLVPKGGARSMVYTDSPYAYQGSRESNSKRKQCCNKIQVCNARPRVNC